MQFSRFYLHFSPRAFLASLHALFVLLSSRFFSPPVFRTCIYPRVSWTSLLALFEFLSSRFMAFSLIFRTSLLAFFGLLSSRVFWTSLRAFFTQDHGISRDLASGLQVVLKEISIESRTIPVHHGALPFVFSLDPLEVMNFYYLFFAAAQARTVDG